MPAAAVIPVPVVCVDDVAVKMSVAFLSLGAEGERSMIRREVKCHDPNGTV